MSIFCVNLFETVFAPTHIWLVALQMREVGMSLEALQPQSYLHQLHAEFYLGAHVAFYDFNQNFNAFMKFI
jgi:hypothetical protein